MKPLFIIISAPSGAGKTTLCDMLLQSYPELCYSISCTTRAPRSDEEDGIDYHFMSEEKFKRMVNDGHFLEYAEVHGNYYGTLKEPVYDALRHNQCVLLDIDVEGATQLRDQIENLPDNDPLKSGFLDIFIKPPSLDELRNRLVTRGADDPTVIQKRMENAAEEMRHEGEYRYQIVNDDIYTAFKQLCDIINVNAGLI